MARHAAIGGLVRYRSLVASLLACCLVWAGIHAGRTQPVANAPVSERSIKAAYLCKFAGYVQWPDSQTDAAGPLTIGVLNSGAMMEELTRITAGRRISDRQVLIRQIESGDPLDGLHMLFVGERDRERLDDLLLPARQLPILTVTESVGALAGGSVINFTIDRERVRFEVSLPAAERSQLKLSSRLLAVAQRVQRVPER